ncbi:hypothetical protein CHS0354_038046 [Potamilus streckersoni]|nr:hypothetical protein CHS0354_038046 [Potamilus streckersoni]
MEQQRSSDGKTPVILACEKGNSEQLKKLLDAGADVTVKDEEGKTALHYCADNLETQCAEMLLEADTTLLNIQDEQMYTPMHMAVLAGNENLLKLLIERGADIHCLDENYHTLVHLATASGHPKILEILIQHEADLSSADNYNAYPIHYAAQLTSSTPGISDPKAGEKILKRLLDAGVAHDVVDSGGRQPLLWAACSGNVESCKVLIKAGADVNATDKDDLSALHCAASRGKATCIELLKKSGANVNMSDKNKCTPLFYAITLGNIDCTRVLLKSGADPNHVDMMGRSPAHCAAVKGCLDTIKLLEKEKGDLWITSSQGDYPVHEAAQGGYLDVVKYLLKQRNTKDAVNVKNHAGRTCLHIAAITNNLPLCKTLLNQDVEKNPIMRHKGKEFTPYDIAVSRGYNDLAEYLRSQGCYSLVDLNNLDKIKEQERESKSAKSTRSKHSIKLAKTPEETDEQLKVEAGPSTKPDIVLVPVPEPVQKEHKPKTAIVSAAPAGTAVAPKGKHEDEKEVIKDKEVLPVLIATEQETKTVKDKESEKVEAPVKEPEGQVSTPISRSRVSLQEKEIDRVETTLPDEETLKEPEKLQRKEIPTQDQKEMDDKGSMESVEETTDAKVSKDKGKAKQNKTASKESLLYKYSRGPNNIKAEERGKRKTKKHHLPPSPKNVNKLINAIQESVRTYENLRNNSRQAHQMKRAQLYSGPLHDIVMFGKLMDTYRHGGFTTMEEDDLDNQPNDWDEYLRDQLKFVTHIYEEDKDKPGYGAISDTAKEQHDKLAKDVQDFKKTRDGQRDKFDESDEKQQKKKKNAEAEMDKLAQRTAAMFESVNLEAGETLKCARDLNDTMGEDIKQKRKEQIKTTNSPRELTDLKMQELYEEQQAQLAETEKHRQNKHKTWHKKKDEEMRKKLLQAYRPHLPPQVFTKDKEQNDSQERNSGGSGETSISPVPLDVRRSMPATVQRPRSSQSRMSAAQYKVKDKKLGVQMTEYGLRRVRNPPSPDNELAANWTKKYNGNLRERHSLCFVEPKVYNEILKEEKEIKSRYPRTMKTEHVNGTVSNGDVDSLHESTEPTKS